MIRVDKVRPQAFELKAAAATTTAYASGWESDPFEAPGLKKVTLLFTIVKADATSFEFYVAVSESAAENAAPQDYKEFVAASGAGALNEIQLTAADLAATDYVAFEIDVTAKPRIKVAAKHTGGVGAPTLALSVIGG